MGVVLGTLGVGVAVAGAVALALEAQYRGRAGNALDLTPGDWKIEVSDPQPRNAKCKPKYYTQREDSCRSLQSRKGFVSTPSPFLFLRPLQRSNRSSQSADAPVI